MYTAKWHLFPRLNGLSVTKKQLIFINLRLFGDEIKTNEILFNDKRKHPGFWDKRENINLFLQYLKGKLNLNTPNDWNSITRNQIVQLGGSTLLKYYSLYKLKCIGCEEGKSYFSEPKKRKSNKYWRKKENIEEFLLIVKEKLNLKTIDDWNSLTAKQIQELGGGSLLHFYSMNELKCIACPDGEFIFDKPNLTFGFWDKIENVQNFLFELKEKLNLQTIEDWNSITCKQIEQFGGKRLLGKYSIFELKCLACPEGKSMFNKKQNPHGYWNEESNVQLFVDKLKKKYKLNTIEDWNRISAIQIIESGGKSLLSKYSIDEIVQKQYPEESKYFTSSGNRSSQRWLFLKIQQLFPQEEIIEDYFHSGLSRESGSTIQFDIFLVGKNIAFEYHGQQHYEEIASAFAPMEMYQYRDKEKALLCKNFGIQLVVIPYWWDNTLTSLKVKIDAALNKK